MFVKNYINNKTHFLLYSVCFLLLNADNVLHVVIPQSNYIRLIRCMKWVRSFSIYYESTLKVVQQKSLHSLNILASLTLLVEIYLFPT